ncbi:MAG: helix-turn-helix domain-containing protein [Pseudonocardiaceae bacterium]
MTVAVAVTDHVPIFELAVPCLVFGRPSPQPTNRWYEFRLCAAEPGRTRVNVHDVATFVTDTVYGLDDLASAQTIIVPACASVHEQPPADLVDAVRVAHERGARIVSICSGAFVLAAAGLLDGRVATTHWMHAALLAECYPSVTVDPNVLYVDDGDVLTSAGAAAGIDLCLHIVRQDLGAEVANAVARRIIVPAHRPGGQVQYIESSVPANDDNALAPLLHWALNHLEQPLTVVDLARQANTSRRTLIRRFHAATGTTPIQWLLTQRIAHARKLLESTDAPIDRIAELCGMGTAANLRRHFAQTVGVSPTNYRSAFRNGFSKHEHEPRAMAGGR